MIFIRELPDGEIAEFVEVNHVKVGETLGEPRALLLGKVTVDQRLLDVQAEPGDYLLLLRKVGA